MDTKHDDEKNIDTTSELCIFETTRIYVETALEEITKAHTYLALNGIGYGALDLAKSDFASIIKDLDRRIGDKPTVLTIGDIAVANTYNDAGDTSINTNKTRYNVNNLTAEQKEILKQDIISRYNNAEYWNTDLLEVSENQFVTREMAPHASDRVYKVIDILGIPHDIIPFEFLGQPNALGRWLEGEQKILVRADMPEASFNATTWHEVMHAVLKGVGEQELCNNEDFIEKISRALSQISDLKIKDKHEPIRMR